MSAESILSHDWFPRPLPSNVRIGERSWCYSSFAFLHCRSQNAIGVEIGNDTGIYNGTFFDLGPEGTVQIGNYCTLVGAIIATNGCVTIGDYSFIAHEVVLADHSAAVPSPAEPHPPGISIGANCWIGARAILLRGAVIGDNAIIGAGAVVDFEVPRGAIVAGNPAKIVGAVKAGSASLQSRDAVI